MRTRKKVISVVALSVFVLGSSTVAQKLSASQDDKKSESQVRKALADWVSATNRRDEAAADEIWAADVVGWFPEAPEFNRSAAFAAAELLRRKAHRIRHTK